MLMAVGVTYVIVPNESFTNHLPSSQSPTQGQNNQVIYRSCAWVVKLWWVLHYSCNTCDIESSQQKPNQLEGSDQRE